MKRSLRLLTLTALTAVIAAGCSQPPTINRVGVNVVDKSLFTGSWYYSTTVIDVDYTASGFGTYPGDSAYDFATDDITSMPRIRWVIDEDTLFAYRDYEMYEGSNIDREGNTVEPGQEIHSPVAAFAVESHFDIQRDYNVATGEENNVLVENTEDRFWYERQFMRVDWSANLLPAYYGQIRNIYEVIGLYNREPASLFVQGTSDFPASWRPSFDFMSCTSADDTECAAEDRDMAEDYDQGEFYHFSFVTQDILSPGMVFDPFAGRMLNWCQSIFADSPDCVSVAVYVRNSFLKVSDSRQYIAENWPDSRFDRHGYFRLERRTFDRASSSDASDTQQGFTDFRNYSVNRHNIWRDWTDEAGNVLPFTERRTRPLVYYTSTELPAHLVRPSYDLSGAWSQVFMRLVRNLRGQQDMVIPRQNCQTEDPEAYCYCTANPETGEVMNPTCAGHWDPFVRPEEYLARGATNPYDCWVDVPEGADLSIEQLNNPALSDEDFYGWFGASFQGSECMVDLRINTCNRASVAANEGTSEGLECQNRGDMRYQLLSYVDQPGTPFLGVATLRGDPVTGEIRAGDANIGGPALDGYRTRALQEYDLINEGITDRNFLIGEDVRDYLSNVDRIQPPNLPVEPFIAASVGVENATPAIGRTAIANRMAAFEGRARALQGPEGRTAVLQDRMLRAAGTDLEARLMGGMEMLAMSGAESMPAGYGPGSTLPDEMMEQLSPFRTNAAERLAYQRDLETRVSTANMMMPNEFVDASVSEFVRRHAGWPRARLEITLNQLLYYQTQLHELGHCLGLRHDFGASADIGNYDDDYYIINNTFPNPIADDFDTDGTPGLSLEEQTAFETEYRRVKDLRELAGIDRWMNSSIMEYTAQWYERTATTRGAGRYDHSAINAAYADLTEIYDNSAGLSLAEINPINTPRQWVTFYNGGDSCEVDTDCPYAAGGPNGALLQQGNLDAGLTQRCVQHPNGGGRGNICSNFNSDFDQLLESSTRYVPVNYNFCTDDLADIRPDCHRFDEGDSYREIVRNLSEQYDRQYIFTNFRRYRSGFSFGGYLFSRLMGRQWNILQSMYAGLVFDYLNDDDYRNTSGNYQFDDHFLAAADTVNFYARLVTQPALDSYNYDEGWQRYERTFTDDPTIPGADLALPLGMARYSSSEFQRGLTGLERLERIGTFFEKRSAMEMLTGRGFVPSYGRDALPFWVNFYDLFPEEIQQIFQGMMLDQPEVIAPRVRCSNNGIECEDPELIYLDFYTGDPDNPRPPTEQRYAGLEHVDTGAGFQLQAYALIFGLRDLPTFFDTTFDRQVFVCVVGEGDCPDRVEGQVEGVDYIEYASEDFGKTFRAWQVNPRADIPSQRSISFEYLREAKDLATTLRALQTYRGDFGGSPFTQGNLSTEQRTFLDSIGYTLPSDPETFIEELNRVDQRIGQIESFTFYTQQWIRLLGIAG
ncbi:MAG: hypothetical protein AAF645_00600 [Myxococcota bacterium]